MNLSRDKSKVQDPGELDSIHGRANRALDGGIDYRPSPRRLHECQFANQEHTLGKTFVRIRMPNVHSKKLIYTNSYFKYKMKISNSAGKKIRCDVSSAKAKEMMQIFDEASSDVS